jgi:hypothetical protein
MLNIRILFTNYDIITDFLNLAFCSEHLISIKHRILAIQFNSDSLYAFNHRSSVRDRKPVVRITCVLMFDILSNEKSRNSRRGFDLLTVTHC